MMLSSSLASMATLCLLALFTSTDSSNGVMQTDALFLMASSHHQRRALLSRAFPRSNTNPKPTDSRSESPLVVFYGMALGSPVTSDDGNGKEAVHDASTGKDELEGDTFLKGMMQRKKEFRRRYQNFREQRRSGVDPKQETIASKLPAPTSRSTEPRRKQRRPKTRFQRTPPMAQIIDIEQFKDQVINEKYTKLVVVRFYAPWCRACQAIESSFHRLPREFHSSGVKFVEVPLTKDNAYLHEGLGVTQFPFAHIYVNGNFADEAGDSPVSSSSSPCLLTEELKINKRRFPDFKRILQSYVDKECDVYYSSENTDVVDGNEIVTVSRTPQNHRIDADASFKTIPNLPNSTKKNSKRTRTNETSLLVS